MIPAACPGVLDIVLVTSIATVGGALGSGFERAEAIRAAAFSKREQERRDTLHDDHGDQLSQ